MRKGLYPVFCFLGTAALFDYAEAALPAKAVRETVEAVARKFAKEAAEDGTETLLQQTAKLATRYGEDALVAIKKCGPSVFRYVDEAGEHGPQVIKMMPKYGDDAVWVVSQKNRLVIFIKHGDDAGEALIKHKEAIIPLLEKFGQPAGAALKNISPQNGRRLIGVIDGYPHIRERTPELLEVIGRYGDDAMAFIWRNKAALATAAVLGTFLANPAPYIDGTLSLAGTVVETTGEGITDVMTSAIETGGAVVAKPMEKTNWTLIILLLIFVVTGVVIVRFKFVKFGGSRVSDDF